MDGRRISTGNRAEERERAEQAYVDLACVNVSTRCPRETQLTDVVAWYRGNETDVGLATGDRGFNPSRCAVECDLRQVVHAHASVTTRCKLGVKRHTVRHAGPVRVHSLRCVAIES